MNCKVYIKAFDAKNLLSVDNIASNPYLRFWFKGKQDSAVKTKTIYNTLNPSWNQDLEIISDNYNTDILQVCIYTEDKEVNFPLMDIYEYPLRYRLLGEHFVFNEEIKKQNLIAGILHFELDFLIYPELPLNKEVLTNQEATTDKEILTDPNPAQENDTNSNNNQSDLKTDIIALKKENNELKQQFKEVINQTAQVASEIKADIQELKNENKLLLEKLAEKSDTSTEPDQKGPEKFLIDKNDEKYYENEELFEDGNSIVYKTTDTRTSKIICKKVLKIDKTKATLKDYDDSVQEFEKLCSLHHPCLCDAIGINNSETVKTANDNETTTIALFFEYCPNSIKTLLDNEMIDNTLKTKIVIEIAHALLFVHNHGLIHRDLTFDNVLLNSIFEVKIINLGLSQICEHLSQNFTFTSSEIFMSPEMREKKKYDFKTDVYSFGVLLYYIFCKKQPDFVLNDNLADNKKFVPPEPSQSMSEFCINLVSKCLNSDPNERPTFKDILEDIRKNSYSLASNVDVSIISRRDDELKPYDLIE